MIVVTGDLGLSCTGDLRDGLASSADNAVCVTKTFSFRSQHFPHNESVDRLIANSDPEDPGTLGAVFLGDNPDHFDLEPGLSRALGKSALGAGADLRRLHLGGFHWAKIDMSCAGRILPDCHTLFGTPERHLARPR